MKRTEAEIACAVVTELQRQGFTVYEEVVCRGPRADIVAVRGAITAVVEVKATMSLRLLDQLVLWTRAANLRIAAVGSGRLGPALRRYAKHEGLGVWTVAGTDVNEQIAPRFDRHCDGVLRKHLRDEQRSGEFARAGTAGGSYWTPFGATARQLRDVVRREPGVTLRAALGKVSHHYASSKSAMSALPSLLRKGVIAGVRLDDTERCLRLYPEEPAA